LAFALRNPHTDALRGRRARSARHMAAVGGVASLGIAGRRRFGGGIGVRRLTRRWRWWRAFIGVRDAAARHGVAP